MTETEKPPLRLHEDAPFFREALAFTVAETGFAARLIEKDYYCGPVVPAKLPNNGGSKRNRSYGEPHTGTKVETPDTAKGAPREAGEAAEPAAEGVEGRGSAEGSLHRQNMPREQDRTGMFSALYGATSGLPGCGGSGGI